MTTPRAPHRGFSILEVMLALAVLTVGILGMWHLHVFGLTSTAAARRNTIATAMAGELVSGLERLGFNDPLLTGAGYASGTSPPTPFGQLVAGSTTVATGARDWSDSTPVPGVRLDSQLREATDATANYRRHWTVWGVQMPNGLIGANLIAVSVTWNDPPFARPREVVQYAFVPNPSIIGLALGGTP
jgi:prepilin-type N-terminal cleavage/methylation domain-containing protein